MNKYIKISIFLIAMIFLGSFSVYAKVDKQDLISQLEYSLPEQAGIYDIPGRPDLKLRVYVYHDKSVKFGKPSPVEETCGLSDPDSSSETPLADWKLPATWIYRLNTVSVPSTVGANNLSTIAQNAVKEWSNAIDNKVLISRGSNTTTNRAVMDGQNIIAWGRAPSGALAVSYIWYRADGIAVEIDTIMNNKYVWYWSNPLDWPTENCAYQGAYDAQNILTHELGHTIGLNDVYSEEYIDNTMYGYGSKGETKKNTLTTGDINGAKLIY